MRAAGVALAKTAWTVEASAGEHGDCVRSERDSADMVRREIPVADPIGGPPCRVIAVPSGVQLSPSDGSRPDPGSALVVNGAGRFFSSAGQPAPAVVAWEAGGTFLSAYERRGEGSGGRSRQCAA